MLLPCHDRSPLSSPTWQREWRVMARWFSDNECAAGASRCFGSAFTVTAASVIAARPADCRLGSNNDAVPTAATSRVRKDDWTIVTGSGSTAVAGESMPA